MGDKNFTDDRINVVFDKNNISTITEWKRSVFNKYGWGGQRERLLILITEDLKKLEKEELERLKNKIGK